MTPVQTMMLARFLNTSYLDLIRQPLSAIARQWRFAEELATRLREEAP